ncbi:MAG: ABC transporter permease [Bacteroidia bacterium]
MKLGLVVNTLVESSQSAVRNFKANKLRTALSLLGVCVGILCITGILTLVDSLEKNIQQSFAKLGDNVFYIQKNAWGGDEGRNRAAIEARPDVSLKEKAQLQKRYEHLTAISYSSWIPGQSLKSDLGTLEGVTVTPVNHDYLNLYPLEFADGGFFSKKHDDGGAPVAVIGHNVAQELYKNTNPLGKTFVFNAQKVRVVGVLEKEGQGLFNFSSDNVIYVPQQFVGRTMKVKGFNGSIMVKVDPGYDLNKAKYELTGLMRSIRRLKPAQDNNFAVNQVTSITNQVSSFFDTVSLIGWVLAGFSILVGGFGIANIMFVTVKERTNLIGVEKALGAPNYHILTQFLGESVMLCTMGGAVGIGFIALMASILNQVLSFTIYITVGNVLNGLILSSAIGIIAGFLPARRAARLDPIVAIRS